MTATKTGWDLVLLARDRREIANYHELAGIDGTVAAPGKNFGG